MPITTSSRSASSFRLRPPGNRYSSDVTYQVAVVLASNRRCWDLIEQRGLRDDDTGKVSPQELQGLFGAMLSTLVSGPQSAKLSEVNWQEVAECFDVELPARTHVHTATPERAPEPARSQPTEDDEADALVQRPIAPDVLSILRESTLTDQGIRLPGRQLERKLYERVDEVLTSLGGKWNRSLALHRFDQLGLQALDAAISTGLYADPKDYGFFPTPPDLVRRVIDQLDLRPHHRVLEPSAGQGALADAAAQIVGIGNVKVVEMLSRNRAVLLGKGYELVGQDFLKLSPADTGLFDFVIMNPPFDRLADIVHVLHAAQFLADDGVLVAIMSPGFTFRDTVKARAFRAVLQQAGEQVAVNGAGAFRTSGTNVNSVIVKLSAHLLPEQLRYRPASVEPSQVPEDSARAQAPRG